MLSKARCHDGVHTGDGRHQKEGEEAVFERHKMQPKHNPAVGECMHAHPEVRGCDAEAGEVSRSPQQGHSMKDHGAEGDHHDHAKFAVQAACCASNQQQNQCCLSGDGVVIMALCQRHVEANQGQQGHAQP